MSLLIFHVAQERALVAVDTACIDAPALAAGKPWTRGATSKLLPFVHIGAVLAYRGLTGFAVDVWTQFLVRGVMSFDDLVERMPEALDTAVRQFDLKARAFGIPEPRLDPQEIVIVGFSRRERHMIGLQWSNAPAHPTGFSCEDLESSVQPWFDEDGQVDPSSPEAICAIARVQVERVRQVDASIPIGGNLVLAALRPDCLTIERLPLLS